MFYLIWCRHNWQGVCSGNAMLLPKVPDVSIRLFEQCAKQSTLKSGFPWYLLNGAKLTGRFVPRPRGGTPAISTNTSAAVHWPWSYPKLPDVYACRCRGVGAEVPPPNNASPTRPAVRQDRVPSGVRLRLPPSFVARP